MNTTVSDPGLRSSAMSPARARARAAVAISGGTYLAAWLVGLVVAPSTPDAFAPVGAVHAFFVRHHTAALLQSVLVHGVAGLALAGWVTAVAHRVGGQQVRLGRIAGLTAAALSLAQLGLELRLVQQATTGNATGTNWAFDTLNRVDSIKLLVLAVMVAAFTLVALRARARRSCAVLGGLGVLLALLLPISGAAFLLDSTFLTALLYGSLPLLLVWVAAVTAMLYRHPVDAVTSAGVR